MRLFLLCAASGLALIAAACSPKGPPATRAALDCPTSQGDLERVSAAPDGKSCLYRASDGTDIELRLLPVHGGAEATLAALEAQLLSQVAIAPSAETAADAATDAVADDAAAARAQADADAAVRDDEEANVDVKVDVNHGSEDANIDVPGMRVVTKGDDHAEVDLPGIHIRAKDNSAKVQIGPIKIDAEGDQATVRMWRDVRLRGEALSREKRGVRAFFLRAGDELTPFKAIGYQAGGPKQGPLTVAVFKSNGDGEHLQINEDLEKLVRKNGGV